MKRLFDLVFGLSPKKRKLPGIAPSDIPATVVEATELMMAVIPKQVQDDIRAMKSEDIGRLHFSLGKWARNNFQLSNADSEIRKQIGTVCADNASSIIVWAFWERLQKSECSNESIKS
jgi:hypothetical protein